ncbi:tetraacyldisaccharide 4'-kinase [Amylibacter sp. IMCC11727]|uniref:tetraacyldisaccharide 4'-kinase n=1 Tax=Amylibacter sp. IMCC11727 TaxID=3039851 RepID=UPI00244DE7A9|nr:tetraacyldisaccharide 4'-kinase [Amylibacter sp. IMCC11727]WGI22270.1 tetraacyldisaccharide 4'-kinase [Amylibacter sp. IMCC11727]
MKAPVFWFNSPEKPGLWPRVLHPLSILWRVLSDRRQRKGKHEQVSVPVICVGNINVGGTGKTPTVIKLQSVFNELGVTAHVISKGYGGSEEGPLRVDEAVHTASDVGDEPLLLAAFGPCWIAKDRAAGAKAAIDAGAEVLILDDGMQNPDLAKDFTIMVVDAGVGFGNERLLPAGPLRQSIADGLLMADMVLSIGPQDAQRAFAKAQDGLAGLPHLKGALEPLETGMLWHDLRAFAFAGIGRPKKFFDTLRATGANVVETRSFGDHETLSTTLLRRMEMEAASAGAQMVTTEKDAVRLPKDWRHKVITLPVRLQLDDEDRLKEAVSNLLNT